MNINTCLYATKKQWASRQCSKSLKQNQQFHIFYKPLFKNQKLTQLKMFKIVVVCCFIQNLFNLLKLKVDYTPPVFKTGKQYSVDAIDQFVKSTKVEILRHKEQGRCFYNPTGDLLT